MKFQPDQTDAASVRRYGPGWVEVGSERIAHDVVLRWDGTPLAWATGGFEGLGAPQFSPLAAGAPELVIFGSGDRIRFPRPEWIRPLIEAGIGLETMDTAAACRTYNILLGEGRRVVAALLVTPDSDQADGVK